MTKKECLNADWQQIGYDVAFSGDSNKVAAFQKREQACVKHGAQANWLNFKQGHSDGTVEYCQLDNAVKLGVHGQKKAVTNQVCLERDYPGFYDAFSAGYRLYELSVRVEQAKTSIVSVENQIYFYKEDILRINKKLTSKKLTSNERKSLHLERRRSRDSIGHLDYELSRYHDYLYRDEAAKRSYADFLYNDYLRNIDRAFIDPRRTKISD